MACIYQSELVVTSFIAQEIAGVGVTSQVAATIVDIRVVSH